MKRIGGIIVAILLALGVLFFLKGIVKVPAGYVGVVYNINGGLEKDVLRRGWKYVGPTKKVTLYSIALEQSYMTKDKQGDSPDDESIEIPTKEGGSLEADITYSYSYDENRVPEIFDRFRGQSGKEIRDYFIKPNIKKWVKENTAKYAMIDIISAKRGEVNEAITEILKEKFDKYGIIVDNVGFADLRPDKDTDKAIKKKIKAQEELSTARVTAETDKVNAERDKEVALIQASKEKETAEINAEKAKIKAQGEAEALEISSKAEAEAIKRISGALTNEYNEYIHNKQWNGMEPQFIGGNADAIFDMRNGQ